MCKHLPMLVCILLNLANPATCSVRGHGYDTVILDLLRKLGSVAYQFFEQPGFAI